MRYRALILAAVLLSPLNAYAFQGLELEPETESVSLPTRIDWAFVMGPKSVETVPPDWLKDYPDEQTYELYVPEFYDPEGENGLILFISPTPKAMGMEQWKEVCDELGLILAAPNGAGNQCYLPVRTKIVLDVLDDVRRKFRIDPDRTYIAGFSGGGRRACSIAFALPEYFGGVIPIGSAGELRREMWLRKRVSDRLSVAFVAGADDFNYCEITSFRGPLLEAAGVRTKNWIVDGIGHVIPEGKHLVEVVKWLDETLDDRKALAKRSPSTRIAGDQEPPKRNEQAAELFDQAAAWLKDAETKFDGQMLLKGVAMRWNDLPQGQQAQSILQLDGSWQEQEMNVMRDYLFHRCRGLDDYATKEKHKHYADQKKVRLEGAIMSWRMMANEGKEPEVVDEAKERLAVLEKMLEDYLAGEDDDDD